MSSIPQYLSTEKRVLVTALDDSGVRVFGALRNTSGSAIQLILPVALMTGARVSVQLSEDCITHGKVASCERQDASYFTEVRLDENLLRQEPRFEVHEAVKVTVLNVPTHPLVDGRVSDLSRSGLGLELVTPIPAGCSVKVELTSMVVLGEVKHCKKTEGGFKAGVQIETVLDRRATAPERPAPRKREPDTVVSALKKLLAALRH